MERLLIFSNFSLWMYVCGRTIFTGCGAQIVERCAVSVENDGKLAFIIFMIV